MSAGLLRLLGSARSQTSYCSSSSLYFETCSPPTRTLSVCAISSTLRPSAEARSRSIVARSSGLRTESVVSTSTKPAHSRQSLLGMIRRMNSSNSGTVNAVSP